KIKNLKLFTKLKIKNFISTNKFYYKVNFLKIKNLKLFTKLKIKNFILLSVQRYNIVARYAL
ncbi:hypothetical protein KKG18_01230, partial [Patescibacteria group bacterium]|nr:hypothetical protein [Patescibacteria group bacterium]